MARIGTQLELHLCSQVILDTGINITTPNIKYQMYTNKTRDIPKVEVIEVSYALSFYHFHVFYFRGQRKTLYCILHTFYFGRIKQ